MEGREEEGNDRVRWGTWEELILGGAILRHGSRDWDAVALELQTRTLYPFLFTPQVCKDKYEELLKCYSGNSAWFEEIKRRRIEELRRALEKSEDSIGSLESKLVSLKAKKEVNINADYSSSRAESPVIHISEGDDGSSGREVFKDGSSAGSFTEETPTTTTTTTTTAWAPQCRVGTALLSGLGAKTEPPCRVEKFPSIEKLAEAILSKHGVSIRKRRGKRRRKDLSKDGNKEGSVGENNVLGTNDCNPCTSVLETDEFMKILDCVMANEHASVFQHRHDSQRRARYKKMVRQHMDLDIIKSRIANKCITSTIELLRDLLLLANNALVFYSKTTREYKCALVIRDLVTKKSHQHLKLISTKTPLVPSETPKSPVRKPPVKPRSVRPFNRKFNEKAPRGEVKEHKPPPVNVGSPSSAESSILTKKSTPRRGKVSRVKRGNAGIQAETPMKVRKRARVK